jgi:UTP-glucose-1-phosphate uridylyltransferase
MHGSTVDRLAAMGEAVLDPPIRQQHSAVRSRLYDGAGHALLLARPRGVDDHGLVALLDDKLDAAHEGCLAAHANQRRIQRMVGDQPQRAAGAEHVGALVAIEGEGVAAAHVEPPNR